MHLCRGTRHQGSGRALLHHTEHTIAESWGSGWPAAASSQHADCKVMGPVSFPADYSQAADLVITDDSVSFAIAVQATVAPGT